MQCFSYYSWNPWLKSDHVLYDTLHCSFIILTLWKVVCLHTEQSSWFFCIMFCLSLFSMVFLSSIPNLWKIKACNLIGVKILLFSTELLNYIFRLLTYMKNISNYLKLHGTRSQCPMFYKKTYFWSIII